MINLDYSGPLEAIRARIEADAAPIKAFVGVLPPTEGVSLVLTGGAVRHDYAGNVQAPLQFAINAKAKGAQEAADMLAVAQSVIHRLTMETAAWQLTGVSVQRGPAQAGLDPQGYTLLTSSATARLVYWHDPESEEAGA